MISNKALANMPASFIFRALRSNSFGVVDLSTRNIYAIIQNENNNVKFPNSIPAPGTSKFMKEILSGLTDLRAISHAFCKELALKNIQAKPTQIPVTSHAIKPGT